MQYSTHGTKGRNDTLQNWLVYQYVDTNVRALLYVPWHTVESNWLMYQYVDNTNVIGCADHDIWSKLVFANKSS